MPGATTYIGCVGKDEYADRMRAEAVKDGVNVQYMEVRGWVAGWVGEGAPLGKDGVNALMSMPPAISDAISPLAHI